jgi:hypothetical protein
MRNRPQNRGKAVIFNHDEKITNFFSVFSIYDNEQTPKKTCGESVRRWQEDHDARQTALFEWEENPPRLRSNSVLACCSGNKLGVTKERTILKLAKPVWTFRIV